MPEIVLKYQQYKTSKKLSIGQKNILKEAKKALKKSYSPYSGFQVGAAIELKNGKILSGANFENAAYPLCLCAERVVLAAAASLYPNMVIVRMAVTVKSKTNPQKKPASPCGACRQVILETELKQKKSMEIILKGQVGDIIVIKEGKMLLPLGFDGSVLK